LKPALVLIDLGLRDPPGLEVLQQLRRVLPAAGMIALGRRNVAGYRRAAMQAGADEFVVKADVSDELIPAIRRVVRAERQQRGLVEKVPAEPVPVRLSL
jgi:DNA-binding NarL/FixJ family response regulator